MSSATWGPASCWRWDSSTPGAPTSAPRRWGWPSTPQALGLAEYALDAAVAHATSRTAFGRPISKFQAVSFPLAESKADIEAIRWLVYHLAWSVDEGNSPMLDASIVKYYATEKAYAVADRALQTFGGMGLLKEGPIERILRHLRMLRVVEGASGIQQLVIARSLGM